ncbi:MAG: DUF1579 domain-containing protein [Pyrinomonadaceae bacterium]|nr:DUF1579 domain-containing protein [Pyrinomonadaceae bacterium]
MIPENFIKLVGMWDGTKKLIFSPEEPIHELEAFACVGLEANKKFLKINYEWIFEEKKHEGLLLLHLDKNSIAKSVWIDSFHQNSDFMNSVGTMTDGKFSTKANYTQPEYSDWAWRICLESVDENNFSLMMFNIFPDGNETIAVDAKFKRRD